MRWILAGFVTLWAAMAAAQVIEGGQLTVVGEGRVDSIPDMATIRLGVSADGKTAAQALDQTSEATAQILAYLAEAGIDPRDIQTRDLSLSPLWENRSSSSNQPPRIGGYQASNTVLVRVRDLQKLGAILDNSVESGANTFNGLTFGLQDPDPVQDAARRAAVSEAMRKAALYAEAAGLTLGRVISLTEGGAGVPEPAMMRMAVMSEAVPIAQGEVSTQAQVTMVFAISGP